MNERIKELLDQSGIKVKSDLSGFNLPEDINPYHAQGFDLEKFAELIVRECVTKMALEIMNNSWIDDAVKNTYEHFGVE